MTQSGVALDFHSCAMALGGVLPQAIKGSTIIRIAGLDDDPITKGGLASKIIGRKLWGE